MGRNGPLFATAQTSVPDAGQSRDRDPHLYCGLMGDRDGVRTLCCLGVFLVGVGACPGQQGDQPGEAQADLPATLFVPPAPVLSPVEALESFQIKPGFRIELAAAEPQVEDPVAITFDGDGRMWVVEMRGFMPDIDGRGETEPVGRVVVLEDVDEDGFCETSTVFLDNLVLPRAAVCAYGGALVIEPPHLLFCRDTDGDGRADEKRILYTGFGGIESPEHAGNGLLYGLDNWIYCAQHPLRFRFDGESVVTQRTHGRGQWGITKDDRGRNFYTPNSHPLRGDAFPMHYATRNANFGTAYGVDLGVSDDFVTWPIRVTPGVNRGYREGTLREDFTLATVTAACGPVVYRATLFPEAFRGNAFICEPAGNLVKRNVMDDWDGAPRARAAYEQSEFLASTDERFRPVNLAVGPDGALYVVDMYRGVIQHRLFVTTFLRRQVLARGLDRPVGLGRIWRIVPEGAARRTPPRLNSAPNEELVPILEDRDGWWRDTAQRLLVERRAFESADAIRTIAASGATAVARVQAMWTLDGIGALTFEDAARACDDPDPMVRENGTRLAERWLDEERAVALIAARAADANLNVRVQALHSLGESRSPRAIEIMAEVASRHAGHALVRSAIASGLEGREVAFLCLLGDRGGAGGDGLDQLIAILADCAIRSDVQTPELIELASRVSTSIGIVNVILDRLGAALRVDSDRPRLLELERKPAGWEDLAARGRWGVGDRAARLDPLLAWPGRPESGTVERARPLSPAEVNRFLRGEALYSVCATCHMPDGQGQPGVYPPLAGSPRTLGDERALIRILLHGMDGRLDRGGYVYNELMPPAAFGADDEIAAVLTYIRRAWGNDAGPVTPESVARERAITRNRAEPWSAVELDALGK